jgi:prefoldin subunit 5
MNGRDLGQNREAQLQQAAQYIGYYQQRQTVDDAVKTLRSRADELRRNLASVEAWKEELKRLDATLAAWGDK